MYHSASYRGCPLFKSAILKFVDRQQNLSYAQAVCRRTAKEEIESFKSNIIINIHQLAKIITIVLWKTIEKIRTPSINWDIKWFKL